MKKIKKLSLITLLIFLLTSNLVLAEGKTYVYDPGDLIIAETESEVNQEGANLKAKYGVNVAFVIEPDIGTESVNEYAEEFYKENFGEEPGIVIVENIKGDEWGSYRSGDGEEYFSDTAEAKMFEVYYGEEYYHDGIYAYFAQAEKYLVAAGLQPLVEDESPQASLDGELGGGEAEDNNGQADVMAIDANAEEEKNNSDESKSGLGVIGNILIALMVGVVLATIPMMIFRNQMKTEGNYGIKLVDNSDNKEEKTEGNEIKKPETEKDENRNK